MSKNTSQQHSATALSDSLPELANDDAHSKNDIKTADSLSNPPRKQFTRQRRQLTAGERRQYARMASLHLIKLQQRLPPHAKIGLYYNGFGELPTQPLLDWCQRLGYLPYLPVVGSLGRTRNGNDDKRLRFVPIYQSKLLNIPTRIHSLGMKQNHHRRLLWAHELDVIICPLVAVDKNGNRMGMGGGFYDTTLGKSHRTGLKKPLKIGWCYDFQVVEQLERQAWDVPLDGLITPSSLRWFKRNQITSRYDKASSADSVDTYLRALGNDDAREKLYYSQEQAFNSDELAKVVNKKRLNELLADSDAFLASLTGEIEDFEDDNKDP
ncbi:5-formyltetrahydrofolate cyclo-ligase [Psychrobacter sp. YGAH215]|uniref:5-formyltetrahydrofolate cyclo-ligase n=1 Tax=Psychrobacter sp. YGAH215 TaxID=2596826 RepID=UPI00118661F7|nr:5-formyltetrahydrofolate cyclo-ligase [Psychrobacter sp. YGAH215]TSB23603.1 5-formyltetrahydrofolate cyclo-ligase [Psychrobacter sp. YGAH215]